MQYDRMILIIIKIRVRLKQFILYIYHIFFVYVLSLGSQSDLFELLDPRPLNPPLTSVPIDIYYNLEL